MNKKLLVGFIILLLLAVVVLIIVFFVWPSKPTSPPERTGQNKIGPKDSSWQAGQVAVAGNYADADVIALGDGRYRLYYSLEPEVSGFKGQVYSAISSDGKKWAEEKGTRMEQATFPSVLKLPDGKFRMYYQNAGVIKSAISSDGLSWNEESGTRVDTASTAGLSLTTVGAPTVAKIEDKYVMVYFGAINEKYTDAGMVPNNETHPLLWATSPDGLTFEKKGIALDSRNSKFKGWMDGPELVAWDGNEVRLYFWGYVGIYYSTFADWKFNDPTLTFAAPNSGNTLFPPNPRGDPTLVKIGQTWFMYYGQHQKGIFYTILK